MILRNPFIKPPTPAPQIIYHATDATIAALCTCLSYHKERNHAGVPYTFQELSQIANRQLLTSCDSEWVSLMRIIENEAKKGIKYRVVGFDEEDCLVAERVVPGAVETTDEPEPVPFEVRERKLILTICAVLGLMVLVMVRGHLGI